MAAKVPVNLHHLNLFYYVARHGGVTAAAQKMSERVEPSIIKRQLRHCPSPLLLLHPIKADRSRRSDIREGHDVRKRSIGQNRCPSPQIGGQLKGVLFSRNDRLRRDQRLLIG